MPGYIIHLCIANEYIRKHKSEIKDKKAFINGTIAPDLKDDKLKTHYMNSNFEFSNLKDFIKKTDIKNNDFDKGYLLHLISDDIFYQIEFKKEYRYLCKNNLNFHEDFYCLNKKIIKKYNVNYIPENIQCYAESHQGRPKYIKYRKLKKYINKITSISLETQIMNRNKEK